ncbi:MAG: hypothetical protein DHS20C01_27710 [marine bacterium B5-7]|nr:MAG: hypothetical protein DHS20C01_27710 [marine bacterium B5-7]
MTTSRRDFIRGAARTATAAAIPMAGAAWATSTDVYDSLAEKMSATAVKLESGLKQLSGNVRSVAQRVDYLEARYRLIMALLIVSMMIDGGLSWMLLGGHALPLAVPMIG